MTLIKTLKRKQDGEDRQGKYHRVHRSRKNRKPGKKFHAERFQRKYLRFVEQSKEDHLRRELRKML